MDDTTFQALANKTLQNIAETIENADNEGDIDVDYLNDILNIELPGGEQYVINRHGPMKQIWVSSPVSGAHHFSWDELSTSWISSARKELLSLLEKEFSENFALDVQFSK